MSFDGEYIGAVSKDSTLAVWNNRGNLKFTVRTTYNKLNKTQIFRFTKENKVLAISSTADAVLLDINGNAIQTFNLHKGSVNAVDFSNDGRFIATASSDSKINVWYQNSVKQIFELYNTITSHTDTVWSIDFANNSRYIVSAGADGMIWITSINGDLRAHFDHNDPGTVLYSCNPFFSEFDESGSGITIMSYGSDQNRERCFMTAIYVDFDYNHAIAGGTSKFDYIGFSPGEKYLVYVSGKDVSLISRIKFMPKIKKVLINNYRLLQIIGQQPFFSTDGKYIYTVNGKGIENWFIDLETICSIANGFWGKWSANKY